MMDHLDRLDYAFLGFCMAAFLLCVIAMYRSTPSNAHRIRATQKLSNSKDTTATFPAAVLRDRLGELIGAAEREGVGSCEIANVLEAKAEVMRVAPTSP
jgi:hypothetical protein